MIFERNLATPWADKDLHFQLLLEGLFTIVSELATDHAQGRTTEAGQSTHADTMGTHILHLRLAAWASGGLLFLGFFSKSKHDVAPFDDRNRAQLTLHRAGWTLANHQGLIIRHFGFQGGAHYPQV
jgi:hypothetical protein